MVVQGCVHELLISAWTQTWVHYTGLRRDFPKGQKEGWLLIPWACPGSEVLTSFGCVHVVGQLLVQTLAWHSSLSALHVLTAAEIP